MTLADYLKDRKPGTFKPLPHLNEDGRMVHWFWDNEPSYDESVHHDGKWVGTIHRAVSDKRVVGVNIHLEAFTACGVAALGPVPRMVAVPDDDSPPGG